MIAHHFISVVCLALVTIVGITRFGLLLLSILNMSSPFMHLAKVIYYSGGHPRHRAAAFATFAAAFFLSRLVLFPALMYLNGVRAIIKYWGHGSLAPGIAGLALGTVLEGLQVFWMVKILRRALTPAPPVLSTIGWFTLYPALPSGIIIPYKNGLYGFLTPARGPAPLTNKRACEFRILVSGKAETQAPGTAGAAARIATGRDEAPTGESDESPGAVAASPCSSGDHPTDSEGSSTQHLGVFDRVRNDSAFGNDEADTATIAKKRL